MDIIATLFVVYGAGWLVLWGIENIIDSMGE